MGLTATGPAFPTANSMQFVTFHPFLACPLTLVVNAPPAKEPNALFPLHVAPITISNQRLLYQVCWL